MGKHYRAHLLSSEYSHYVYAKNLTLTYISIF